MKEISKLLIAYDGSECSDAALRDLRRAGLPSALEAVVVTASDVVPPPPPDQLRHPDAIHHTDAERHAREQAEQAAKEARAQAERATKILRADFPGWDVRAEACCDQPAWAVVKSADQCRPGLVVVGSHGHSVAGGRLILGSVSQRVLYEARCSVRVARCPAERRGGPVRLVVGFDGTPEAEAAVASVASRAWPEGSEARVVTANNVLRFEWQAPAVERLRAAGLMTEGLIRDDAAAHALIAEAEAWDADCIFVGTRDLHGLQHLLHGSVSSAVAAGARCSVEVVRAARAES